MTETFGRTVLLAAVLAVAVWAASVIVAGFLETYEVYIGIPPFGVSTYPLASFASVVRLLGKIGASVSFAIVLAKYFWNRINR